MVKEIMDVREIAEYLGSGEKKIYQLIERGEIPVSKIGSQYRFLRKTIDEWLEEKQRLSKQAKKEIGIDRLLERRRQNIGLSFPSWRGNVLLKDGRGMRRRGRSF